LRQKGRITESFVYKRLVAIGKPSEAGLTKPTAAHPPVALWLIFGSGLGLGTLGSGRCESLAGQEPELLLVPERGAGRVWFSLFELVGPLGSTVRIALESLRQRHEDQVLGEFLSSPGLNTFLQLLDGFSGSVGPDQCCAQRVQDDMPLICRDPRNDLSGHPDWNLAI